MAKASHERQRLFPQHFGASENRVQKERHSKEEPLYISALTIKKIIDLLRRAFQYAVNRDLVAQNPFENAILPKTDILKKGVREIDY